MLRLSWLISLGISLIGFLIIGHFFTIQPDESVENGSLGFIGIIFVLPFLLLSIFTTFRYMLTLTRGAADPFMKWLSIVGEFLLVGVLVYFSLKYKNDALITSDGTISGVSSTILNLPKLNEYTYTIYFNFYTFALIHAVVGAIAAVVGLFKPESKKEELPE